MEEGRQKHYNWNQNCTINPTPKQRNNTRNTSLLIIFSQVG